MEIYRGAQNRYQIGYHVVWGVKYHKSLLTNPRKKYLVDLIKNICKSYDYHFYTLGIAPNHVHLFIGAPPKVAPARVVQVIKSITARELFLAYPEIKNHLWGGEMWKDGYYIGTVGEGQTEAIITEYLKQQGEDGPMRERSLKQLRLFR